METTLHNQLAEAFEKHVESAAPEPEQATPPLPDSPEAPVAADPEPKPGRTAGRERDEQGRLLPGPSKNKGFRSPASPVSAQKEPEPAKVETPAVQASPSEAAQPQAQRPPRPSSWKKDYWEHWDKLDPAVAAYIHQRESEAIKGVSTYKSEYDRLKPMDQVMQEFDPILKEHNIPRETWIRSLGTAHKLLATGSPEQKLSMFLKLANDYQVPVQHLFQQGQDGKVYFNPQVQPHQPPAPQLDVRSEVQRAFAEMQTQQAIQQFESQVPTKYPHYEAVKQTMIGLLQAEIATDLEDAYQQALRLPRHADIYEQIQQQEKLEEQKRLAEEKAKQVARARSQAVSARSSTPSAEPQSQAKGVRAALESAVEAHFGSGRV